MEREEKNKRWDECVQQMGDLVFTFLTLNENKR